MKKIFLPLAVLFGFAFSSLAQTTPTADDILKAAYEKAAKENKYVFVIFHASWCGWCHKMDASLNDSTCKKFFDDSYVFAHLVVSESKDKVYLENPGAEEFKTKYNGKDQGLPFWLLFDKGGKLVSDSKMRKPGEGPDEGENTGCPAAENEVQFFLNLLKKTSHLTSAQLEIIGKRFRQNQ
jgi:thioredoxin-related protein